MTFYGSGFQWLEFMPFYIKQVCTIFTIQMLQRLAQYCKIDFKL